jgi:cilia- and flagella-associated protein 57
VQDNNAL